MNTLIAEYKNFVHRWIVNIKYQRLQESDKSRHHHISIRFHKSDRFIFLKKNEIQRLSLKKRQGASIGAAKGYEQDCW